ncbi:MAG: hypothetical protein EB002_11240 [Betaproteobacteria bacterium]|nr:hypothetical protein [Betaproteobacteria bacterium]
MTIKVMVKMGIPKWNAAAPISAATVCVLTPAIMTPGWCNLSRTMPMRKPMHRAVKKPKLCSWKAIQSSYASYAIMGRLTIVTR